MFLTHVKKLSDTSYRAYQFEFVLSPDCYRIVFEP